MKATLQRSPALIAMAILLALTTADTCQASDGTYEIVNVGSGLSLHVPRNSRDLGTALIQYRRNTDSWTTWKILKR